jgi:hypothetical protein
MTLDFFQLIARCPTTHKPIQLQIIMDQRTFARSTFYDMWTQCPHCAQTHRWQKTDIRLEPIAELNKLFTHFVLPHLPPLLSSVSMIGIS